MLAFQGFGIDLFEADTALGYKGPVQGHFASDRDWQFFDLLDEGLFLTDMELFGFVGEWLR